MTAVTVLLATVAGVLAAALAVAVRRARVARRRLAVADAARAAAEARAEDLAGTRARLEEVLEAVPEGVVVWDDGGREVYRNQVAAAFVGARHAEALVESAVRSQLRTALAGSAQRQELDVLGPPRRMLVVGAVPVEAGAVAVIEDVSERRRLEAMRRDFVANISHELKTPVGALGLLAETLTTEDDPGVMRRLAERLTGEAFRVARVIDDLLDLSRIEADDGAEWEPVGAVDVVGEAVDRVHPLAEARSIHLGTDGVGRRHLMSGDRRQLVSAVQALLENACTYSDPGSTVEVVSRSDGSWVELEVRDHGIGIPARYLERVFERFYRVDRARSRETGGTGLGLSIVRHVVSNHGGEVQVESREGEGSTFTIRLPAGPGPVAVSLTQEAG